MYCNIFLGKNSEISLIRLCVCVKLWSLGLACPSSISLPVNTANPLYTGEDLLKQGPSRQCQTVYIKKKLSQEIFFHLDPSLIFCTAKFDKKLDPKIVIFY